MVGEFHFETLLLGRLQEQEHASGEHTMSSLHPCHTHTHSLGRHVKQTSYGCSDSLRTSYVSRDAVWAVDTLPVYLI